MILHAEIELRLSKTVLGKLFEAQLHNRNNNQTFNV